MSHWSVRNFITASAQPTTVDASTLARPHLEFIYRGVELNIRRLYKVAVLSQVQQRMSDTICCWNYYFFLQKITFPPIQSNSPIQIIIIIITTTIFIVLSS